MTYSEDRPTDDAPIDGERSRRIAEIVNAALEIPPEERPAFLDGACGGDEALRRDAEALLAADHTVPGFAAPPPPSRDLIGSTLSHYRIVEQLGAGGMGEVYLAEDEKLGRRVALKVLPRELAASPERLARFRREARTVAALNHPHIVTLHSTEDAQGLYFLTMELLEGGTLHERIVPGGLATDELLRLALPLADALAAAHARGITHRDLKPANVMISGDGRVKVVDFGVAKISAEDREGSTSLTMDGRILGTVAYMSPEQVVGHPVDRRSDVFSLGILLYELATGEHPFAAPSRAEFMSKILRDDPVPATGRNPRLPRRLDTILDRCLEKDPDQRYQDAGALLEDLQGLQREPASAPAGIRRWRAWLAAAAGLLALGLLAVDLMRTVSFSAPAPATASASPPAPAVAVPARTTVAVLYFQNLNEDPQLDWLRMGLTEMLVTDLSQSPRLDVLGTDRLYQILQDLEALENGPLSFELVQQVARRTAVRKVIRGSFAQMEGKVLITFHVEDTATGKTLRSARVEGKGGEHLLSLMSDLATAVYRHLEVAPPADESMALQDVTTSSVEAWRLYTEALRLHYQAKDSEAILLLEKAVELDPGFALALADLGTFHANLGHQRLSTSYMARAVANAERLPLDQRSFIQGRHDFEKWGTYGRAAERFRETLRLYPGDAPRNNLAHVEAFLERYDSAAREFDTLLAQGTGYAPTTLSAAHVDAALDRFERGHQRLLDLAAREPESWIAQFGLGWHLTNGGRLDEAGPALERAAAIRPGEASIEQGLWRLAVLREDWRQAERAARNLAALDDPYARWRGGLSLARNAQFRGAFDEALGHLAAAVRAFPQPEGFTAMAHCWTADLLLDLGKADRALAEAQRAQKISPGDWPELQGMFLAALAWQELGRPGAADALLAELKRRADVNPNAVEERQILRLEGRLALARGNPAGAVAALRKAASLLPPRGIEIHWHVQPDHVPVWYDLGRAELVAGRPGQAVKWFEKVAASGAEHIEFPVAYMRSRERLKR